MGETPASDSVPPAPTETPAEELKPVEEVPAQQTPGDAPSALATPQPTAMEDVVAQTTAYLRGGATPDSLATLNTQISRGSLARLSATLRGHDSRTQVDPLIYDFAKIDLEGDYDPSSLWEKFVRKCYAHRPPIPTPSMLQPVLQGDQNSALLGHYGLGGNASIVFDYLAKAKVVSELDVSGNSLRAPAMTSLTKFVQDSDQLTSLNLSDNPLIGAEALCGVLEELKNCRTLESLNLSHTGADARCAKPIAAVIQNCMGLIRLDVSGCSLRASGGDVAVGCPSPPTLKRVNFARNELFYGGRRVMTTIGSYLGRCQALARIDLSQNGIDSDGAAALLKGLGECPTLKRLILTRNAIDEGAGRAIVTFLGRAPALRRLDLSQNPILNATANQKIGQKKMEEDGGKPGAKKEKKGKTYQPAIYSVVAAVPRAPVLKELKLIGLVVDRQQWKARMEAIGDCPARIVTSYIEELAAGVSAAA